MNKILLIIQREYLTRVRKRSFIVMTILGPLLMAGIMIVPVFISQIQDKTHKIAVLDETGLFYNKFQNTEHLQFTYVYGALDSEKAKFKDSGYYALLYVAKPSTTVPSEALLYSENQVGINIQNYIQEGMKKEVENLKLQASGIDKSVLESIKSNINLITIKMGEGGKEEKSYTEVSMVLGMFGAFLIYFFIFLFGSQVMRGVIEEKTNRIVEVIVSSVRPFQLMMGKIVGVAMVGLTQFVLWVLLTFAIVAGFQLTYSKEIKQSQTKEMLMGKVAQSANSGTLDAAMDQEAKSNDVGEVFYALGSVNYALMLGGFLFYFLGGYLLYAALFAAIGAAVDNEADTQQFMLPITIPLILSFVSAQYVINNPDGPAAFWLSIIPFTSPIIMMIRLPFGVPLTEIILSMGMLILGFLGTTWLAAKIYRTGILMYGKKVDYRELWKWVTYRG
ncbi:MAG: ABC transporter permease [Bacteroidota bacterium]